MKEARIKKGESEYEAQSKAICDTSTYLIYLLSWFTINSLKGTIDALEYKKKGKM